MGAVFEKLCKGLVIVVDDKIGKNMDSIDRLIEEIESRKLPIIKYRSIEDAKRGLSGLLFCNFVILDWKIEEGTEDIPIGVQPGSEAEDVSEQEVIDFIKELRSICLAPVFVVSAWNKGEITSKLNSNGIATEGQNYVFVENKNVLCATEDALVSRIEEWIKNSPHIYLAKWWTNEWLSKNNQVFWDLYELNPNWPAWFYDSFKRDEDPVLALVDALFQLVYSEVDVSTVNPELIAKEVEDLEGDPSDSLRALYRRLVYLTKGIDKDIRPGDIFKKNIEENGKKEPKIRYFLNIRPECDTTKRIDDPELYLLEGESKEPDELVDRYDKKFGLIDRKNEIIMLFLEDNDIVRFDKRKLSIEKISTMESYEKICRVAYPFITEFRQSFSSYLGRFGVPSYPKHIVDSAFRSTEEEPETGDNQD